MVARVAAAAADEAAAAAVSGAEAAVGVAAAVAVGYAPARAGRDRAWGRGVSRYSCSALAIAWR